MTRNSRKNLKVGRACTVYSGKKNREQRLALGRGECRVGWGFDKLVPSLESFFHGFRGREPGSREVFRDVPEPWGVQNACAKKVRAHFAALIYIVVKTFRGATGPFQPDLPLRAGPPSEPRLPHLIWTQFVLMWTRFGPEKNPFFRPESGQNRLQGRGLERVPLGGVGPARPALAAVAPTESLEFRGTPICRRCSEGD